MAISMTTEAMATMAVAAMGKEAEEVMLLATADAAQTTTVVIAVIAVTALSDQAECLGMLLAQPFLP